MLHSEKVVLNRGGCTPTGASLNLKGGASPYASHKMESLFVKFTNKYICFHSLFRVREEWNKGKLFKGEKRLRTTALKSDDSIFNQSDSILNQILNKPWPNLKTYSSLIHGYSLDWFNRRFTQVLFR